MLHKTNYSNIPKFIEDKISRKLHLQKNHPIEIIKNHIYSYFNGLCDYKFITFDNLDPIVSIENNFDRLLIPKNHVTRTKSDSYYVNENQILRTHTSAHQNELLSLGYKSFLVTGDVFRKDEIDSSHYPIFHQMEMFTLIDNKCADDELKKILSGLIEYLFPNCNYRFNDDYFPFTNPSYEIEVEYRGKWMEILGCGIVEQQILLSNNITNTQAIASGFGLDRLAMIFCDIPDIRFLWSTHDRFLNQFSDGKLNKFHQYSEVPSQSKDISFYIPKNKLMLKSYNELSDDKKHISWLDENDFYELIRNNIEDIIEVKLIDSFYNKKLDKYSRTYKLIYSPSDAEIKDPSEFTKCVNISQDNLRDIIKNNLALELR